MPVFKRILFAVFLFASLMAAVYAYKYIRDNRNTGENSLSVLPDSCLVYLSTQDFSSVNRKINSQNLLLDKLKVIGDIGYACKTIHLLDSMLNSSDRVNEFLTGRTIHLAIYNYGTINWLATFNVGPPGGHSEFLDRLNKVTASQHSGELFTFKLEGQNFVYTLFEGNLILSNSAKGIERAVSGGNKLINNPRFNRFTATFLPASDLSLYIDHELFARHPGNHLDLSLFTRGAISAGNIDLEPSEIKVNGFISIDSSEFASTLNNHQPQLSAGLCTVMPLGTNYFRAWAFSQLNSLKKGRFGKQSAREAAFWENVQARAMYNVEKEFYANVGHRAIEFKRGSEQFFAIEISDTVKAREHLSVMTDTLRSARANNELACGKNGPGFFSDFTSLNLCNATVAGNFIYFSDHAPGLQVLGSDLYNETTLKKDPSFVSYSSQHFPDEFNFLFYTSPAQRPAEIRKFIRTAGPLPEVSTIRHLSYSLVNDRSEFRFRFHVMHTAGGSLKQNNLWAMRLDTTVIAGPWGFVNHLTGENELLVQDARNQLYLLNAKGNILWKKDIGERIRSQIFIADAFKNKKHQMVFSTTSALHMIDRLGREVEGFPAKLPAPASSPVNLIHYKGSAEGRLLISCENRYTYNYSLNGNLTQGFEPLKTQQTVVVPVQYVSIGLYDYLVTFDTEGKIYAFSRKGIPRLDFANRVLRNTGKFHIDASLSHQDSWLVYVDDKSALINRISFTDRKETHKLDAEGQITCSEFRLIDDNKQEDILLATSDRIWACSLSGTQLFNHQFMGTDAVDYFGDETFSVIYGLNRPGKELEVYYLNKSAINRYRASGMPFVFDLFKDNRKYLLIPDDNVLKCVSLN